MGVGVMLSSDVNTMVSSEGGMSETSGTCWVDSGYEFKKEFDPLNLYLLICL